MVGYEYKDVMGNRVEWRLDQIILGKCISHNVGYRAKIRVRSLLLVKQSDYNEHVVYKSRSLLNNLKSYAPRGSFASVVLTPVYNDEKVKLG